MHFEFASGFARDGRVLTVEPERLLEFAWGDDRIRIDLVGVPVDPPLTVLTFMHTISDAPDTLARTAAGWARLPRRPGARRGRRDTREPAHRADAGVARALRRLHRARFPLRRPDPQTVA
jgi:uncharacterized protein YndB with AHSA1/START domain